MSELNVYQGSQKVVRIPVRRGARGGTFVSYKRLPSSVLRNRLKQKRKASLIRHKPTTSESLNLEEDSDLKMEVLERTPEEDLALHKELMTLVSKAFVEYMPEGAEDVDEDEFAEGMLKMGGDLTESEARKLFHYIDTDGIGYVTKEDVCTFAIQTYTNSELQMLKSKMLKAMMGRRLVKEGEEELWSNEQLMVLTKEMKEEFLKIASEIPEEDDDDEEEGYLEEEIMNDISIVDNENKKKIEELETINKERLLEMDELKEKLSHLEDCEEELQKLRKVVIQMINEQLTIKDKDKESQEEYYSFVDAVLELAKANKDKKLETPRFPPNALDADATSNTISNLAITNPFLWFL